MAIASNIIVLFCYIECDENCLSQQCTRNLFTRTELIPRAALASDIQYTSGAVSVIPELSFPSNGSVSSWEFAARSEGLDSDYRDQLPHIQIWKPAQRTQGQTDGNYILANSTDWHNVSMRPTERYNVYRYEINPPMPVLAGYVIGIQQPPRNKSRLSLAFLKAVGPTNFVTYNMDNKTLAVNNVVVEERMRLPLLTVQFQSSGE